MARTFWETEAMLVLKAALNRRGVDYDELATKPASKHGRIETRASISNKLCRGSFSAAFLMQCLDAIDCDTLYVK